MRSQLEKYQQATPMIDEQLDNWCRYYRDNAHHRNKTLSLEGKYLIQRKDIDYEEESLPQATKPINAKEAIEMEKVIITLPDSYKLVLVIEYMYRYALKDNVFHKTCRIAKVKPYQWADYLKKAKLMVENRLNTIDNIQLQHYSISKI